jgi:hypothetical protein
MLAEVDAEIVNLQTEFDFWNELQLKNKYDNTYVNGNS